MRIAALDPGVTLNDSSTLRASVRPRRSLGRAWLSAAIIGSIPLFGALYWLASQGGDWRQVLVVQVVAIGLGALVWVRHAGAFAQVTDTTITKQAFFSGFVVNRADVASVVIANTWRPGSTDSHREMLLKDASGATLMRFGGSFWSTAAIDALVEGIGAPVVHDETPVSSKEFLALHPGAAYWYEGKAWVAVAGIVVAFAFAFVAMSWIMHAIGADSVLSL